MKKPLATAILCAAVSGVILSSAAFAAPTDYAALKAIKPVALVEKAVADAPVPAETTKAFNERRAAASKLIDQDKDYAKGIQAFEAAIKEFAAYPSLVRQLRGDLIWRLGRSKDHVKEAIATYDALIAEQGRTTGEKTSWLRQKRNFLHSAKLYKEANEATKLLLAQPDIKDDERFNLVIQFAERLGNNLDDAQAGYDLALAIATDTSLTPSQRVRAAFLAGHFAGNKLKDQDRIVPTYRVLIKLPGVSDNDCHRMIGHVCGRLIDKQKAEQAAEAFDIARSFYMDPKRDLQIRINCLNDAANRRNWLRKDADKMIYVAEIEAFIEKNAKDLKPEQLSQLNGRLYEINKRHAPKSEATLAMAEKVFSDPKAAVWQRIGAIRHLAEQIRGEGKLAEATALYRKALPVAKDDVNQLGELLKELAWVKGCENDLPGALAVLQEAYRYNRTANMTNRVTSLTSDVYRTFNKPEKAFEIFLKQGNRFEAAKIARDTWRYSAPEKAQKLFREVVADEKQPDHIRKYAYEHLLIDADSKEDIAVCDKYFDFFVKGDANRTNAVLGVLANRTNWTGWPYYGEFEKLVWAFEKYEKLAMASGRPYGFKMTQYSAIAYATLGRHDRAAEICRRAVSQEGSRLSPVEAYELAMVADLLPRKGSVKDLTKAVEKADKLLAKELPVKERSARIERIGSIANMGDHENLVRALDAYRDSLYVPTPKKRYVVEFSEKPLLGIAGWDQLAKKPVAQKMDRSYGGSMDFLVTDVATGNRGEGIAAGKAKATAEKPSIAIVCDNQGIHFRFEVPDDRGRDIENGIIGAGTYEGYIAPGPNQPYVCILLDVRSGELSLYNTTYDTTGHRRIKDTDLSAFRTQTYFTDKSVVSYLMLSWENYATLIPSAGTVWDFENVLWGRQGNAAWNGTESIHGRSTWGELEFRIPEKARAQILKRVLFQTMRKYNAEKRCSHSYEGIIDHWKDPAVGDPAFYEAKVKPLVEKLDAYLPLVKADMSDTDIYRVADEALPGWRDIRYTIARLRQQWLAEQLAK